MHNGGNCSTGSSTKIPGHKTITSPKSRVATLDVCAVGLNKHHLAAMIEVDVTGAREKITLTVLIYHDVMDGAPVTRFIGALSDTIKKGM